MGQAWHIKGAPSQGSTFLREHLLEGAPSHKDALVLPHPRSASSDDNSGGQTKLSGAILALFLLALRANCEVFGSQKIDRLISQLKLFLEDEKKAIGEENAPEWVGPSRGLINRFCCL